MYAFGKVVRVMLFVMLFFALLAVICYVGFRVSQYVQDQQPVVSSSAAPLGFQVTTPVAAEEGPENEATPTPVVTATVQSAGQWVELTEEFEASGDLSQTFNVDHDGDANRQTIVWYHADFGFEENPTACSIVVITEKDGERVTMRGAKRTWEWTGSIAPTKEQREALLQNWIAVLEQEPRGECAHQGAYSSVLWQNTAQMPSATATKNPPVEVTEVPSLLLTSNELPKQWSPSLESNLAICWGNSTITVNTANSSQLSGDACRIYLLSDSVDIQTVAKQLADVLKKDYPQVEWQVVYNK